MTSIDSVSAQSISRAYVQNTEATQGGAAAHAGKAHHHRQAQAPQSDTVSLSDGAKSLAAAREAVQSAPDVREQKVSEIKQQISDGTYAVSSRVLARKMLNDQQSTQ